MRTLRLHPGIRTCAALTTALLALGASSSEALADNADTNGRLGIGVGLDLGSLGIPLSGLAGLGGLGGLGSLNVRPSQGQIHVPILINDKLRIEPGLGFYSADNNDGDTHIEATGLNFGLGFFYHWSPGSDTLVYVGPRLGLVRYSTHTETEIANVDVTIDTTRTSFYIGVGFGGEYFFAKTFSLGGEAQLLYYSLGETETEVEPDGAGGGDSEGDDDGSIIGTSGVIFVRWYFL